MSIGGFHCHAIEISIQKYRMPDAKRVSCRKILICNLSKFQECRVFRCWVICPNIWHNFIDWAQYETLCWCSSKCHMVAMKYICNANFCCLFWPRKWLFIPIEPTNIYLNTFILMLREHTYLFHTKQLFRQLFLCLIMKTH